MNAEDVKKTALKHAPAVGIAVVVAAAAHALSSSPTAPSIAPIADVKATPPGPLAHESTPIATRLVSCGGDGVLNGDDKLGTVTTRVKTCTVLFADRLIRHVCTTAGGTIDKLTKSDLVVTNVVGGQFTYRCTP